METVNQHSLEYLLLCSAEERNSYRFETTYFPQKFQCTPTEGARVSVQRYLWRFEVVFQH